MVGKKSPRKSTVNHSTHSGKLPANIKRLIKKGEVCSTPKQSPPMLGTTRPRRFSLIYSSESSLSDVSDSDKSKSANLHRNKKKAKNVSNNSQGKKSKLIQRQQDYDDEGTQSSDYRAITDEGESENEEEESEDDEDDDGSDSDSETSSDDENIDFVKLTAQRKKRAMKALSAMNTNSNTLHSSLENSNKNEAITMSYRKEKEEEEKEKHQQPKKKEVKSPNTTTTQQALSFKFKRESDGISFGNGSGDYNEDIGEEVLDLKNKDNDDQEEGKVGPKATLSNNDELRFPNISESDESEYDIDQDAYFDVINNENSHGEIGTDLETGDDDLPILEEEEQNIVSELQNDDQLSFDGSIHEEGSDPVDDAENKFLQNEYNQENGYDEEDEEDEIMSDFDMPFYEDPKFANLYYYGDGSEPKLSLSTSLPLMLNDEKLSKLKRKEAKKREQEERKQRRKLHKKSQKPSTRTTSNVDNDEYIFNVFFQSDDENNDNKSEKGKHKSDQSGIRHKNKGLNIIKSNDNLEPSIRNLGLNSGKYNSSDDEYDNILLDVAHLPSDDENSHSETSNDSDTDEELRALDSDSLDIGMELNDDYDEDDDDDSSVTNVFIDIDDLDPDSFYFHYDDSDGSSSITSSNSEKENLDESKDCKHDLLETVVYVDGESTDEDDNLPPPSSRTKNIGSKAKEIVSSNVVGLRPPKLGTWETDNKPFSIIDGLSTKSLYALIQEHQQLREQHQRAQTPDIKREGSASANNGTINGDELTLNELLNMSELEDDSPSHTDDMENNGSHNNTVNNKSTNGHAADWYEVPKVPLSAFRNKGINAYEEDEYMLPANSNRKVPIGYLGNERTRKKIDKMKELQRKKTEKKRQLKKKKKLLKIRKEREKARKEQETMSLQLGINVHDTHDNDNNSHSDMYTGTDFTTNENTPMDGLPSHTPDDASLLSRNVDLTVGSNTRKNSTKSVGLDEIHEILGKDENDLLPVGNINDYDTHDSHAIGDTDADILASLTAPVQFDNTLNHENSNSMWRRRQSMVEAAAENLRFTKNGLFSESALADIEGIMGNDANHSFEFNDVLQ